MTLNVYYAGARYVVQTDACPTWSSVIQSILAASRNIMNMVLPRILKRARL